MSATKAEATIHGCSYIVAALPLIALSSEIIMRPRRRCRRRLARLRRAWPAAFAGAKPEAALHFSASGRFGIRSFDPLFSYCSFSYPDLSCPNSVVG
jgi:hypothetical protein